jgi:hypothetical protein
VIPAAHPEMKMAMQGAINDDRIFAFMLLRIECEMHSALRQA